MHMSDALISPAVGGTFWMAAATALSLVGKRLDPSASTGEGIDSPVPLTGIMGAFVFAAQMINFAIPGTGSSGHLAGGMLLAILLGPHQALLAMAALLTIQALFFADGGLLALGCNIVNMAVIPCWIVYPLLFRPLVGQALPPSWRWRVAVHLSALLALLLGALGIVLETTLSGMTLLPWGPFALTMLGIHLVIGLVEGAMTIVVAEYALRAGLFPAEPKSTSTLPAVWIVLATTLFLGGIGSWFAAPTSDGLEWSIKRVVGNLPQSEQSPTPEQGATLHTMAAQLQKHTTILPDYGASKPWGEPDAKKSFAGLLGGVLTILLAVGAGWVMRKKRA
ncbi:MAG: energy-coupling factor ABC transporter permease [Magnetococcales bacterium]|nr:energy-coupling factor ABC transporter permease [Magnetococcales bacterium]